MSGQFTESNRLRLKIEEKLTSIAEAGDAKPETLQIKLRERLEQIDPESRKPRKRCLHSSPRSRFPALPIRRFKISRRWISGWSAALRAAECDRIAQKHKQIHRIHLLCFCAIRSHSAPAAGRRSSGASESVDPILLPYSLFLPSSCSIELNDLIHERLQLESPSRAMLVLEDCMGANLLSGLRTLCIT